MGKQFFLLFVALSGTIVAGAQNIGIGTAAPVAKLQINHRTTAAIPSLRLFDSAAGTGNRIVFTKENVSNTFTLLSTHDIFAANSSLDIRTTLNSGIFLRGDGRVGINNITSPAATLHVGGGVKINDTLNVTNDINIEGRLKLNGNPGLSGQVLVSSGSGAEPQWTTSSFPSNERAWVRSNLMTTGIILDTIDLVNADYNNSTATFNFTNNTITINKSGLYRFQGQMFISVLNATTSTGDNPRYLLTLRDDNLAILLADELMLAEPGDLLSKGVAFSVDRYVVAGSVICLTYRVLNLFFFNNITLQPGDFSFYLIGE